MDTSVTILGAAVLAVLLAGYLAQNYLPPPPPKILGVDLGTTFSCVAVYEAVTGHVHVIPADGSRLTIPSVVAFTQNGVSVGHEATRSAGGGGDTSDIVYDAKRFIGKVYQGNELKLATKDYPFSVVERDGEPRFKLSGPPWFVSPEDVSAHIIRYLVQAAVANLSVPITKVVMAVPAEFDESQRNATRRAAQIAGVDVLRIISEPIAAALAYGLHKKEGIDKVIVIDVGGGTTDVALLNVQHSMFFTQAIAGDNHLGGQDFTRRLTQHLQSRLPLEESRRNFVLQEFDDLHRVAEQIKLQLTTDTLVRMPLRLASATDASDVHVFPLDVARETFEEINRDLFQRILGVVDLVLEDAGVDAREVDEVVLVGGSTRIPRIREEIAKKFGRSPNVEVDPELAVARGVAIQAGILGGMWPLQVSAIEMPSHLRKIHAKS